jgi:hypothetical protein
MDKKLAYTMGRNAAMSKVAAALRPHKAQLVKLAKTLNALERKGKLTKAAADAVFDKSAGILGGLGVAGLGAAGAYAAPHIWRGLKAGWKGLTGGGAKPGAKPGAAAEGAAGEADTGSAGAPVPAAGEVTDKGMANQMQRYMGMNPAALSQMQAAQAGMLGRTLPYRQMAGTMRGMFGAM